jgi:hypothetical protein
MAVTRGKDVIIFGAAGDLLTNDVIHVESIHLEHSAAANATIQVTYSGTLVEFATLRIGAGLEPDRLYFKCPKVLTGFKVSTLSAGNVKVYLE